MRPSLGGQVIVAIVGAGDIGRGWASLCIAQGWPVRLFDHETKSLVEAHANVITRARRLVALGYADAEAVERGVANFNVSRSLLQACAEAHWIIEAIHEDVIAKQKMFEAFESVGHRARIVSSSTTAIPIKDIVARCRRQDRCMIAHPLNPPELIPLVEVVPGPHTDGALVELLKGWLRALGRIPITVKRAKQGNVAGRIAAAVWREAIDLVLTGVVDVADLDRAVAVGPALGWAAAGPHLTYHLAAGGRGVEGFIQHLLSTFESTWADLATWQRLDPEQQHRLVQALSRAYQGDIDTMRDARDAKLVAILKALEEVRRERESLGVATEDEA